MSTCGHPFGGSGDDSAGCVLPANHEQHQTSTGWSWFSHPGPHWTEKSDLDTCQAELTKAKLRAGQLDKALKSFESEASALRHRYPERDAALRTIAELKARCRALLGALKAADQGFEDCVDMGHIRFGIKAALKESK